MSIWSRLIEAALAIGGPIADLVGQFARDARDAMGRARDYLIGPPGDPTESVAFTIGVIVLGAKMASVDGEVVDEELAAFHEVFHVPAEDIDNVRRIFRLAKRDALGFEAYARQIAAILGDRWTMKEDLLTALLHIAKADGTIHHRELDYLGAVAVIFGFDEHEFERIVATEMGTGVADPFAILGVARSASDAEIKAAWRRLVRDNHPDRAIAEGLPKEFVDLATQKVATINAAYRGIMRRRTERA